MKKQDFERENNFDEKKTILEQQEHIETRETILEKPIAIEEQQTFLGENISDEPTNDQHTKNYKVQRNYLKKGDMFAHYRIEKTLGRGGMGVVYKAFDEKLQRSVALKLILSQDLSDIQLHRFLQEAQATAKLEHPNIVKLFSTGEEPQHYLVMEYIPGTTLSQLQKIPYKDIALLCSKIANALHFAHEKDIVHRDIKPSNIMIGEDKEPKVMDFGLAKMLDTNQSLSNPGFIVGTLAYMPIEQAEGGKIDRRTDIYSLGATLYELLCNRPPFEGESHLNILNQIYHQNIISPTQLNPDIPRELEAICLKCLEKTPEKRYATAEILANDLQNYVENRPITATPPTALTHLKKFILRNKMLVLSLSIIFVLITSAGFISYFQWQYAEEQRGQAEKQQKFAEEQSKKANLLLAKISQAKAKEFYKREQWANSGALAGAALEFIKDQKEKKLKKELKSLVKEALFHYGLIWEKQVNIHPKKTYLIGKQILAIYQDGTIKYIDMFTRDEISKHQLDKEEPLFFSSVQNNRIAIASEKKIILWNCRTKELEKTIENDEKIQSVALSPAAQKIAVLSNGTIQTWNLSTKNKISIKLHDQTKKHRAHKVKEIMRFRDNIAFEFINDNKLRIDFDGSSRDFKIGEQDSYETYNTGKNKRKYFHNANTLVVISKENNLDLYQFELRKNIFPEEIDVPFIQQNAKTKFRSNDGNLYKTSAKIPYDIDCQNAQILVSDNGKIIAISDHNNIYLWKVKKRQAQLQTRRRKPNLSYNDSIQPKNNSLYQIVLYKKFAISTEIYNFSLQEDYILSCSNNKWKLWNIGNWQKERHNHINPNIEIPKIKIANNNPHKSDFDFRTDLVPGWYIEQLLEVEPKKTVSGLFQKEATDTLTIQAIKSNFLQKEKK